MKFINSLLLLLVTPLAYAQYEIKPAEGYAPRIGILVDMMEELKDRITESVKDLDQEETDYLFDEKANSIGSLIMHMAATEAYYQVETLENRMFTKDEEEFWAIGLSLGDISREKLRGKPISYYLKLWDEVRQKTLEGLKKRDDAWLNSTIDEGMNNYWAWFHILEHSANHMGQIELVKNRL